jgi:hypothetical protein
MFVDEWMDGWVDVNAILRTATRMWTLNCHLFIYYFLLQSFDQQRGLKIHLFETEN